MMNYTALIVAAVVSFIIGMVWYSPMLFGNAYMKAVGHHGEGKKGGMAMMMVLEFIFGLVSVWALRWVLRSQGVATLNGALTTAAIIRFGFILMNAWSNQMWENKAPTAMRISALCRLVCLLAAAAVLVSI